MLAPLPRDQGRPRYSGYPEYQIELWRAASLKASSRSLARALSRSSAVASGCSFCHAICDLSLDRLLDLTEHDFAILGSHEDVTGTHFRAHELAAGRGADGWAGRFEILILDAKDAYQVAYMLSARGEFFATGSNIQEKDGKRNRDRAGEVVFCQTL